MNRHDYQYRSHFRYYWIAWIVVLGFLFFVRLFWASHFSDIEFVTVYVLSVWLPIMLLNFHHGRRLMGYLQKYHPAKWAELTTIFGFGPGYVNGFRSVPWLFSSETFDDATVVQLKRDYRNFLYFCLTVFFTFPIVFIALSS